MRSDTTTDPGQNRTSYVRFLQERAAVLLLGAFVLATAVGLWQLYSNAPDLYTALVNVAVGAYALGILALAVMVRRMRRGKVLLQDAQARTRAIVETVADGVLTLDERGLIESVNAAAVRIFGHSAEEVAGRHVSMLLPVLTGDQNLTPGEGRESKGRRKDGTSF